MKTAPRRGTGIFIHLLAAWIMAAAVYATLMVWQVLEDAGWIRTAGRVVLTALFTCAGAFAAFCLVLHWRGRLSLAAADNLVWLVATSVMMAAYDRLLSSESSWLLTAMLPVVTVVIGHAAVRILNRTLFSELMNPASRGTGHGV